MDVWRAPLDLEPEPLKAMWALLPPEERQRAERLHFERDRRRFVASQGWLRVVLAHYVGKRPEEIRFARGEHGKPYLTSGSGGPHLRFNMAHSHALGLYAVAWGREVGIDLEYMRPELADEQIAAQFFSPAEVRALASLPADQWQQAFFACWTRKEAYLKALGQGLLFGLDQFSVSLDPDAPPELLGAHDASELGRWSLMNLEVEPEYGAALVVEGRDWQARYWRCESP
ncbi:MAG: 4'-phosphopantetheinyl transferase superfamily protein [Anaerolineae bacterium]|nr:4'-phosphopantetheinyl transferase superfamily protein [Anaerolineae bacterium]